VDGWSVVHPTVAARSDGVANTSEIAGGSNASANRAYASPPLSSTVAAPEQEADRITNS
jgi:hypothetical protein